VTGAAEAGEIADEVGAGFTDRLAPLLEAGVVAGIAQDGGD